MNTKFERLLLIFLGVFAIFVAGVATWQIGWVMPQKACEKQKKWWDHGERVCAQPVLISDKVNIWREIVEGDAGFAASDTIAGTLHSLQRWLKLPDAQRSAMKLRAAGCYEQHFHMASAARRLIETITPHAGGRSRFTALK